MQLFRVKDCKQMDKKNEPIGFRIYILSAQFHIYSIQYQNSFLYVMRWVVLLSLLASLAVLVCAVVLRDHTRLKHLVSAINTPFLGIITMRSFGGTIRWNFVRLAFLVGAVCLSLYAMQYLTIFHIIAASGR